FVISQTNFSHQSRVRRQAIDVRLARKFRDVLKVGTVREDFHGQIQQAISHPFEPTRGAAPNASSYEPPASSTRAVTACLKVATVKSAASRKFSLYPRSMKIARQPAARAQSMSRHRSPTT